MDSHNNLLLSLLVFFAPVCRGHSEGLVAPVGSGLASGWTGGTRDRARDHKVKENCEHVWNTPAIGPGGTYTCGERIEYLEGKGKSAQSAQCQVASEIPLVCGPCCPGHIYTGDFTVVTQNLSWWKLFDQENGGNFFQVFSGYGPFDIMAFQECDDVNRVVSGLGLSSYFTAYEAPHALALAWNTAKFQELEKGYRDVGEDGKSQYYGKRGVAWVRLRNNNDGKTLLAMNHNGPLPVNTGGQGGGQAVADNIMKLISDVQQYEEPVVLMGDFNADSDSSTIKALRARDELTDETDAWLADQGMKDSTVHIFSEGGGGWGITIVRDTGSLHNGIKMSF